MNFKLKTLVAAVALAACAGQASATVALPTATTASDAIFFAIDSVSKNSFVFDLGAASGLSSLNQNITGSAWTQFLTAEGNSFANVVWGIAYDFGNNAATSLWGTTVTAGKTIGSETSSKMSAGRVSFNNFLGATALTVAGTSAYSNSAATDNLNVGFKNTWGANANGFTSTNKVGTAADFYTVTSAGKNLVVSGITFDGTTVAAPVTSVPEPESYAMLLGGLMMIGAIARRRRV